MKATLLKQLRGKVRATATVKYTTFFVCLAIATSVWLLLELGKTYSIEITVPIKYSNYPKNKQLINEPVSQLLLNIEAKGSNLIKLKLFGLEHPLKVDLSQLKVEKSNNVASFVTSKNQVSFKTQLGEDIELLGIYPEKLTFEFSDVITQKKKVKLLSSITFKQQYMMMGEIELTPEYIEVSGPVEVLDTLKNIFTEPMKIKDLDETKISKIFS